MKTFPIAVSIFLDGILWKGAFLASIFLISPTLTRADLIDPAPQAEQTLNWKMGDMRADPLLDVVYILNITDNRIVALDTNTGAATASVSVPGAVESGKIAFSIDGGTVYVSTPKANSLHSFSAGTLTPVNSVSLDYSIRDFIIGSDGFIYAGNVISGFDELVKIDVSTGSTVDVSTTSRTLSSGLVIRNSTGSRFFFMAESGSGSVEEFSVNPDPGGMPNFVASYSTGVSNARDLTFDESSNFLYGTGGGTYGIRAYNINTSTSTYWPYDSPYGTAVAQISGNPDVFGASGDGRIRRFEKSSAFTLHDYAFEGGGLPSGDLIHGNLEVTPNGHVVYGKESGYSSDAVHHVGLIGHGTLSLPDSVSLPDPRAHKEVTTSWEIGDTLGDPDRNVVYIVDEDNARLIAFDTVTGQATADVSAINSPVGGKLGLSPDGGILFFTTPATARIHRFDAANGLAYLGSADLTFPAYSFVIGSDGYFYATKGGDLQKVNATTGAIEGEILNPDFYGSPLIRRNSDGSRLFVMELGLSGGSHAVDEFAIAPGDVPSHIGTAFSGGSNDRDLTIDDTRNTMYRTGGGIYGVSVWRGDSGISNYWPFDSPYGAAVAQNPTSSSVFGASASEHIREFDKDSGKVIRTFDHEDYNSGFLSGTVLTDGLEVAMNDVVVYGKSNSSSGPYYLGVIGLDDFSFPRSGPTRPMNVSATDGTIPDKVEVTWDSVMGATSYEIYRENDDYRPSSSDTPIAIVTTTLWEDLTASNTQIHRYWIKAVNAFGESTFSDKEYGSRVAPPAPGSPSEIFASDGTDPDQVVITWSAVDQATSYQVYRNTTSVSGSATQLASGITDRFWTDSSATVDVGYFYWIRAVNEGGVSSLSPFNSGYKGMPPPTTLPEVPMGISATQGTRSIEVSVSWNASDRAETYRVYRSLSNSSGTSVEVANSLAGTNWVDTSVLPWTTYYYWVMASNEDGDSDLSGVASGFAKGLPRVPTSVTASDAAYSDRIEVSWTGVPEATSYKVYRNSVADENSAAEVATEVTASTWSDTNAVFGNDYYYWVKSVNEEGDSEFSASDVGSLLNPLAPPTGVTATDGSFDDRIDVSWGVGSHATSYKVFRNTVANTTGAQVVASGLVDRSWSDTNVTPGTTYYYWIKSTNVGGDSVFSGLNSGYARLDPIAPTGLAATVGTLLDRIRISWVASSSADEYRVYRADQPGGPFVLQGSVTDPATAYLDFQPAVGITYYYHVRAWTSLGGLSEPGSVASGHRGIANPGSVVASDGLFQGEVKLSWDLVPGASEYRIFRGTSSDGSDAVLVGNSSSGEFTDATGTSGEEYHYFVKSATGDAVSGLSTGDTGMATVGLPFRPDGLIGKSAGRKVGNDAYFPTLQQVQLVSKRTKTLSWYIDFQNDGETTDEVSKTLTKGNRFFKVKLISFEQGNVTALAYSGRLGSTLSSEASTSYKLSCKPSRSTRGKVKKKTFSMVGRSGNDDQMRDLLRAKAVTSKK
ncbi:MAG: hypothetical protein P1U87_03940 [Verrucomicrobiales bacterium]|nr:hypothetical protein [Verrucomicrobiales bacterium]